MIPDPKNSASGAAADMFNRRIWTERNGSRKRRNVFPSPGMEPVRAGAASRQNTTSSQDSNTSRDSARSSGGEKRQKRASQNDNVTRIMRPQSRAMSLPEFRKYKPVFYWPQRPGQRTGPRVPLLQLQEVLNPNGLFKEDYIDIGIGQSLKSRVISTRFDTEDGTHEHLAAKIVPLDKAHLVREELKHLASIEHNHIIAVAGCYVESGVGPGNAHIGILLYPLAVQNMEEHLNTLSAYNSSQERSPTRDLHPAIDKLLTYFPCLCRAVMYLHDRKEPIKHKDIKPSNVLIDAFDTVILADFDIATQYTDRIWTVTSDKVIGLTRRYAPQSVKDNKPRGLEWDVYSLSCVFLDMATVMMGETGERLRVHFAHGQSGIVVDYSYALRKGRVETWISHLKKIARDERTAWPRHKFSSDGAVSFEKLDTFLDDIHTMMKSTVYDKDLLANVWKRFNRAAGQECEHCHPQYTEYGNPGSRLAPPRRGSSSPRLLTPPRPPSPSVSTIAESPESQASNSKTTSFVTEVNHDAETYTAEVALPHDARDARPDSIDGKVLVEDVDGSPADTMPAPIPHSLDPTSRVAYLTASDQPEPVTLNSRHIQDPKLPNARFQTHAQKPRRSKEPSVSSKPHRKRDHSATSDDTDSLSAFGQDRVQPQDQPKEILHSRRSGSTSNLLDTLVSRCANLLPRQRSKHDTGHVKVVTPCGPERGLAHRDSFACIRGLRVFKYDPTSKEFSLTSRQELKQQGLDGFFLVLPRDRTMRLNLPGNETNFDLQVTLHKALKLRYRALQTMGMVKMMFVMGKYTEDQLRACVSLDAKR